MKRCFVDTKNVSAKYIFFYITYPYRMSTEPMRPRNMKEMQYELLEEGRLSYEDAYTLDLVTKSKIPYDEYQELITDRRNHHSRMMRFAVQVGISGTITAFTIAMLAIGKPEGVYLPVLTGILGYWLPAPEYAKLRTPKTPLPKTSPPATPVISPSPTMS